MEASEVEIGLSRVIPAVRLAKSDGPAHIAIYLCDNGDAPLYWMLSNR